MSALAAVTFTDAQLDHLKGMLDVAHNRVFRTDQESRPDASTVEALLEAALCRAAGATVQKLPDERSSETSDRETERLKRTLVRSTELVSELLALTKEPNPKAALDCIAEYLVDLNRNLWDLRYAFDAPREESEVQS